MLMLDLFSGLGGASAAMVVRGWTVVRVDNDPIFHPDILADLLDWEWGGSMPPDLLWASPPCTEFSREDMPWTRRGIMPDLSCILATYRIIAAAKPRFWVLENVRGAVPYIGRNYQRYGSRYLWGAYPLFLANHHWGKVRLSSTKKAERARIPYEISLSLALSVEASLGGIT